MTGRTTASFLAPYLLQRAWPAFDLDIIESEGQGGPLTTEAMCTASDAFAS